MSAAKDDDRERDVCACGHGRNWHGGQQGMGKCNYIGCDAPACGGGCRRFREPRVAMARAMDEVKDDREMYDSVSLFKEFCRVTKRWGLYLSWGTPPGVTDDEVLKAAPYLAEHRNTQAFFSKNAFVTFGTMAELYECYQSTVGDDGPTPTNRYFGPARVYALTIGPDGRAMDENT